MLINFIAYPGGFSSIARTVHCAGTFTSIGLGSNSRYGWITCVKNIRVHALMLISLTGKRAQQYPLEVFKNKPYYCREAMPHFVSLNILLMACCRNARLTARLANRRLPLPAWLNRCRVARSSVN